MISIQQSKFGKGLFASIDIPKNTIVTTVTGAPINFAATIELNEKESHTLQIGPDEYIFCDPPFLFSNHSCNPNCGLTPNLEMRTLKNIKQGQELLWDYSTSMLERHWTMPCKCGSANCRHIIRDFDLLPEKLQARYIRLDIVQPFILEKMKEPVYVNR